MKKIFASLLFLLIITSSNAQYFRHNWTSSLQRTSVDATVINNTSVVDSNGNVYTTKVFDKKGFIQKLNLSGDLLWTKTFSSTDAVLQTRIALDFSGNIITTGLFRGTIDCDPSTNTADTFYLTSLGGGNPSNIFIQKMDADGNFIWAVKLGPTSNNVNGTSLSLGGATSDSVNNIYVGGSYNRQIDFNPSPVKDTLTGGADDGSFIVKLNSDGNFGWVTFTKDGSNINDITFSKSNHIYVTGGGIRAFTRKYNLSGSTFLWEKRISGSTSPTTGYSIAIDNNNNIITTGYFTGNTDFNPGSNAIDTFYLNAANGNYYIQKLNADGNFIWAKNIRAIMSDLCVDSYNNIYTTGNFTGTVDFNPGLDSFKLSGNSTAFLQTIDSTGKFIWACCLNGNSISNKISVYKDQYLYISGNFTGTVDFDPNAGIYNLTSTLVSQSDAFVEKLNMGIYWLGIVNSDWQVNNNWSRSTIPDITSDVIIPAPTPYSLIIKPLTTESCRSFSIQPNAIVTVDPTAILNIVN